ncbi:MAG: HAD family hydrolase [Desulfobacterales bacterium]
MTISSGGPLRPAHKLPGRHRLAVATGRTIDSAVAYLQKFNVPVPDIIISSVNEIYYGPGATLQPGVGYPYLRKMELKNRCPACGFFLSHLSGGSHPAKIQKSAMT